MKAKAESLLSTVFIQNECVVLKFSILLIYDKSPKPIIIAKINQIVIASPATYRKRQ